MRTVELFQLRRTQPIHHQLESSEDPVQEELQQLHSNLITTLSTYRRKFYGVLEDAKKWFFTVTSISTKPLDDLCEHSSQETAILKSCVDLVAKLAGNDRLLHGISSVYLHFWLGVVIREWIVTISSTQFVLLDFVHMLLNRMERHVRLLLPVATAEESFSYVMKLLAGNFPEQFQHANILRYAEELMQIAWPVARLMCAVTELWEIWCTLNDLYSSSFAEFEQCSTIERTVEYCSVRGVHVVREDSASTVAHTRKGEKGKQRKQLFRLCW